MRRTVLAGVRRGFDDSVLVSTKGIEALRSGSSRTEGRVRRARARLSRWSAIGLGAGIVQLLALCPNAGAVIVSDHRDPSRGGGAYRLDAPPVFELRVQLAAGVPITFETRNASRGADPVLHLLAPVVRDGRVSEVAWDDDSAENRNARFSYTPAAGGAYMLVMRATWNGRGGSAELYKDGRRIWSRLPAGGAFKRIQGLRTGESLTTLALPRGPRLHVAYVLDDRGHLLERYTSGAGEVISRSVSARPLEILLVAPVWPDVPGPIRLVRNDVALAGHDPDGDGLGTELETNIGTCSSLSGSAGNWECSRSTDARDTDGDGLTDGVELLGQFDRPPYQWLARWGADPRHKDLFIEVDFMMRSRGERPQRLSRDAAMEMARIYGDAETDPLLRLSHAQSLGNPDREPGIRLHLDTGVTPAAGAPEEEHATYGDWGGVNVVQPVCDGDDCKGADARDVWRQQMHECRRGLFHYALAYAAGGGQSSYHSVAFNLPMESAGVAAHELGHTFGLDHNGPYGSRLDANCKPNYPSIMSYAYLDRGWGRFSDGYGRDPMNNAGLVEQGAVRNHASPAGRRYLEALRDIFDLNVDLETGDVDWNRDGVFSAGSIPAYSNNNGSGCEMTRNNVVHLAGARSQRASAVTRMGNMTLAFFIDERGSLEYEYTLDSLACPQGAAEGCGPPMNLRYVDRQWNQGLEAFDAHPIPRGGGRAVLVVFRDNQGRLFETIFTRADLGWTEPRRIPTAYPAVEDLSLAGDDSITHLAYRNADGIVVLKTRSVATGAWAGDAIVRDASDAPIPRLGPDSSPGLLFAPMPAGSRTLFGVFPVGDQGNLRLYSYDPATLRWSRSPWSLDEEPSVGRPALAFVPVSSESPLPGRLYLLSMRRNADGKTIVRDRMLTARRTPTGLAAEFGSGSDHDNSWFFGYGVDLLFEPGVDSNLRSLIAVKSYKEGVLQPPSLELRPKADGIVNILLRDWNDWEVLRVDLCRTLVDSASSGIRCPAWEW